MAPGLPTKTGRKAKNRATKLRLVFDEDDRRQFLKGFKKRKDERKLKAKEELELRLKEEKKRMKEKQREYLKKMFHEHISVPEIEHLVEPVTHDLPNHTVTISAISNIDFQGKNGFFLGQNKTADDDEEDDDEQEVPNDDDNVQNPEPKLGFSEVSKTMKKERLKALKTSKAVKIQKKQQQKKDRQQFKKRKRIMCKREKHKGRKRR